ncbi:MAG: alpha-amylase family glycosyl hydrolase [Verrucomicrobiota bacterium]
MLRPKHLLVLGFLVFSSCLVFAEPPPLTPDLRAVPGEQATPWLRYQNPAATSVMAAGSWDGWAGRYPMDKSNGVWVLDARVFGAAFGQHEFKFLPNNDWEAGPNRPIYINGEGELERPSDLIFSAAIEAPNEIVVWLRRGVSANAPLKARLVPETPIKELRFSSGLEAGALQGCFIAGGPARIATRSVAGGLFTVVFDEKTYGLNLEPAADRVVAAGNFNGWDSSGGNGRWLLKDDNNDGIWELTTQLAGLRQPADEKDLLFKFVINGNRWLPPPPGALNATADGKGNVNLKIDPQSGGGTSLKVVTENPLVLSQSYVIVLEGVADRPIWSTVTPGEIMEDLKSAKQLGAILDREHRCTTYRLFAPRARSVHLCLFDTPQYEVRQPEFRRVEPVERYPLWKDEQDGVWEISLLGLDVGKYYSFNVDGPAGNGEGFEPLAQIGDPYARAAAHSQNNTIVVDPDETNAWFGGWSDDSYVAVAPQDAVIYEMHIRDLTVHPSAGVPPEDAGKYEGLIATEAAGTGLGYLKDLGVTTLEIMPMAEFSNGEDEYNWGYAPVFYFAPEASYAKRPLKGSQYFEFKRLVNELHRMGFGVILDVVFNHVGSPNIFHLMDKKYFFRLNPDFSYSNFSGCGNDFKTESPMARRLIVDNIVYWMKEFHVDGFRFDLAELIDMDTMLALRDAARAVNTNVILVSEPWSFRGENKHQLKGTGWSAWNNDFRYAAKDFVMGRRNREWLQKNIFGSVDTWASDPLQPVNYLESHDDMALADELCTRPDRDGRSLQDMDVAVNRLAATVLFTSLGIPMISEGQEFIRSKWGLGNTYNKGDEVNAIRWTDRERPKAAEALAYYKGLIQLRRSPQGAAFRVAKRPPASYYQWILPPDAQTLAYIVNAPRIHDGSGFVVLLNASGTTFTFTVPLPAGRWRLIGDGERIDPAGLPDTPVAEGPQQMTIQVPGLRAFILMDGF